MSGQTHVSDLIAEILKATDPPVVHISAITTARIAEQIAVLAMQATTPDGKLLSLRSSAAVGLNAQHMIVALVGAAHNARCEMVSAEQCPEMGRADHKQGGANQHE